MTDAKLQLKTSLQDHLALHIGLVEASAVLILRVSFSLFPILSFSQDCISNHSPINIQHATISFQSVSREIMLRQYTWKILSQLIFLLSLFKKHCFSTHCNLQNQVKGCILHLWVLLMCDYISGDPLNLQFFICWYACFIKCLLY